MNRIVFVTILLCVFLSTALLAQKPPQKPKPGQKGIRTETDDEVARFLIDMERQWLEANISHDPSILERMLADDYQIMRPTGRFSTKSEEIARVKASNPSCKLESDHLDDAKVRVFGDVAVLYAWETFVVKCTDKVNTGTYFWSDLWLKRRGRWQAVAGIEPDPTAVSPLLPPESKPVAASGASAGVYVQKENRTETNDEVARYITDMERQWLQANMTQDAGILEKILADDFQMMHENGRFSTKAEEIAFIKSHKCKLESDHLDDSKVRVFGDVAVAYGWETFSVKCGDKVKTGTYFWGGTVAKTRWTMAARGGDVTATHGGLAAPAARIQACCGERSIDNRARRIASAQS